MDPGTSRMDFYYTNCKMQYGIETSVHLPFWSNPWITRSQAYAHVLPSRSSSRLDTGLNPFICAIRLWWFLKFWSDLNWSAGPGEGTNTYLYWCCSGWIRVLAVFFRLPNPKLQEHLIGLMWREEWVEWAVLFSSTAWFAIYSRFQKSGFRKLGLLLRSIMSEGGL